MGVPSLEDGLGQWAGAETDRIGGREPGDMARVADGGIGLVLPEVVGRERNTDHATRGVGTRPRQRVFVAANYLVQAGKLDPTVVAAVDAASR